MTDDELAAALRLRARTAPTGQANSLLKAAATFERTPIRAFSRDRRKVVEFRVGNKGYRTRGRKEQLGGFSLAGL